jgi:hypothetical protein
MGAFVLLPPVLGVGQLPTFRSLNEPSPRINTPAPSGSKVVNIYPINGRMNRQDPAAPAGSTPSDPAGFPSALPSTVLLPDAGQPAPGRQDAGRQDAEQSGQPLPGLPDQFGLQIPADEVDAEVLPDSRETAQQAPRTPGISWVGLKDRARPRPEPTDRDDRSLTHDRRPSRPLSYAVRRPSPPPPVINVFQPAIVQVPFHIQVVPMYVEHYPTWFGPATPWPHYFGQPSVVPIDPSPLPGYYGSATPTGPARVRHPDGIDHRLHVPTDQPMFFVPDVNLVPQQSNSVDYVSFPHNFHSYPRQPGYGVNFQTFPVHRRLP